MSQAPNAAPAIVVVGSYNLDLVLTVARLPAPGETCLALGRSDSHGGKGSNQAIQAARCGARVAMLAAVGEDAAGVAALSMWRGLGLDVSGVARLAGADTGSAVILVDAKGENSIVVDAGANARLDAGHVEAVSGLIARARLVAAQLETPVAATRRAFALAREAGGATLLNAAPAPEAIDAELLALTDILVVNEGEARTLAGTEDPAALSAALLPKVGRAVVLTLGVKGAVLLRKDAAALARPARPVEVVDTTGAGDAFIGAFAARLVDGGDQAAAVESALDWGLAAGALACTRLGAASSFADRAAVASLAGRRAPAATVR
jgi:ribokinase